MRIKQTILNIFAALTFMLIPLTVSPVPVFAAGGGGNPPSCGNLDTAKGQVLQGIGLTGNNCDDKPVNHVFAVIVRVLSMIVGIVSVIVIILSGFKYITSGGDANRIANAKSTLLYALVGLAVAATAQLMVQFVLFRVKP